MDHLRNFSHIVPPFDMYGHHQPPPPFMSNYATAGHWDATIKSPSSPKSSSQSSPNPNPSTSYQTATPWTLPPMTSLTQPLPIGNNYSETTSPVPPNTTITSSSSYYSLPESNPNIYAHNPNLMEPLTPHPLTQVLKNKVKQNGSSFQLYETSSAQNGFYSEKNWTKTHFVIERRKEEDESLSLMSVLRVCVCWFLLLFPVLSLTHSVCLFFVFAVPFSFLTNVSPFSCACVYLVHIKKKRNQPKRKRHWIDSRSTGASLDVRKRRRLSFPFSQ